MTQAIFHFSDPVNLERGKSLLMPITNRSVTAERVSLYQPDTEMNHALASVRLVNDTGTGLPPGALTIYERPADGGEMHYVGDAQMSALPVGQERLLSYAVDLKVKVDREEQSEQIITDGSIVDGVLNLVRSEERTTIYKIAGAMDESRIVVLEHPRIPGFDLRAPKDKLIGTTPTHFRIRQEVAAGQTVPLSVVVARPIEETVALVAMPEGQIRLLLSAMKLSEPVRSALARIQELKKEIAAREAALMALEKEQAEIVADQERLRKNLEVTSENSDLYRRYTTKLNEQEDRLEVLRGEIENARQAAATARKALTDYVRDLRIERQP